MVTLLWVELLGTGMWRENQHFISIFYVLRTVLGVGHSTLRPHRIDKEEKLQLRLNCSVCYSAQYKSSILTSSSSSPTAPPHPTPPPPTPPPPTGVKIPIILLRHAVSNTQIQNHPLLFLLLKGTGLTAGRRVTGTVWLTPVSPSNSRGRSSCHYQGLKCLMSSET